MLHDEAVRTHPQEHISEMAVTACEASQNARMTARGVPMDALRITPRTLSDGWEVPAGRSHRFVLSPLQGYILEAEDVHFHFDSAVLLADYNPEAPTANADGTERMTGIRVLATCYLHAQEAPSQKLLITGHTDTSGSQDYNLKLSEQRAEHMARALLADRDGWVAIAEKKHQVEDIQAILKWIYLRWGWDCDPGKIDNVSGSKTRGAIRRFQERYNLEHGASIAVDGEVGKQTWGAFFDRYQCAVAEELKTDVAGLAVYRQTLTFLQPGCPSVGCGEHHPIEGARQDNYKSATDRRVELLFFDPGEEPKLACHPGPGKCVPESCELYNPRFYGFQHIWFALWSTDHVNRDTSARMIVTGPDLAAGTEVTFEVIQDGYGPIGSVSAIAESGRAEAGWSDWYKPESVVNLGELPSDGVYPEISFRFSVKVNGRLQSSNERTVYGDHVDLQLRFILEDQAQPSAEKGFILVSPWGRKRGLTSQEGRIQLKSLPPGGALLIVAQQVLRFL